MGAGNFQFLPACQGHRSCTWFPYLEDTRKEQIQSSHLRCWPPTDPLMPLRFLLSLAVGRGRLVLVVKHGKYRFLCGGHIVLRVGPMGLPANEFETQKARLREGALPVSIVLLLPSPSEYGSPRPTWKSMESKQMTICFFMTAWHGTVFTQGTAWSWTLELSHAGHGHKKGTATPG